MAVITNTAYTHYTTLSTRLCKAYQCSGQGYLPTYNITHCKFATFSYLQLLHLQYPLSVQSHNTWFTIGNQICCRRFKDRYYGSRHLVQDWLPRQNQGSYSYYLRIWFLIKYLACIELYYSQLSHVSLNYAIQLGRSAWHCIVTMVISHQIIAHLGIPAPQDLTDSHLTPPPPLESTVTRNYYHTTSFKAVN